ncbi:MAG: J domain-containing protein [Candidatus Loosdrechtia sp.]|uniref:J domain-containing protein n=1 Tax=Candidatus Loosdrechtia sp. TaxID=3101272 RepID=UPI003A5F02E6|nr:MAG: DnaJ domain-containing protein [Candidatus Jettenia sp. AMX2]
MVNYYDILEVHYGVSKEEIRRSFRALIKKYHPDIHNKNRRLWAESKTKSIIQAYKTLSNSTTREQYDRLYKYHSQSKNAQKTCKKEEAPPASDLKTQARIILADLLERPKQHAVKKYECFLKNNKNKDFLMHLNHRDYVDCKFLLGEAYEELGEYNTSLEFYEYIIEREKNSPYRQHLLADIKERIRNIYCRKLAKSATPGKALNFYKRVLNLDLCKNQNAFIYKKMAECHMKLFEYENALKCLSLALSLKPNLQGTNKLREQLKRYIPNLII